MYRVGMIVPSSNTCLEPVTYNVLNGLDTVSVHFARVPVTRIALDADAGAQFAVETMTAAARLLADAGVDIIAWNGTAGSWLGPDYDRQLCAAITGATGIPATTSTLALLEACRAYGVTRLGLAVPYTADVTDRIVSVYGDEGIDCAGVESLGLSDNTAFAAVPADRVRQLVSTAATAQPHAVAVVCTNVFGAPEVADLEAELGIPVFDSVTATLWEVLRPAGISLPGWGTLLEAGLVRAGFQDVMTTLLAATGADRTTLRVDVPAKGLHVDLTAAEALGPGVRSIRRDSSIDQRALHTVRWIDEHRRLLVQPHFRADPSPPQALIDVYGVTAQMLAPVIRNGQMAGWISAHSLTERPWSDGDHRSMEMAVAGVHKIFDEGNAL